MYDELISALRNNADHYGFVGENGLVHLLTNAADAIEELSRDYESIGTSLNESVELVRKLRKPRWIPVTERLPELNVAVLVYNKYYGPMVGWRIDGERFRIPGSRFPDHPTHYMPLPEPPKEE